MSWFEEVIRTALVGLSPIWIALVIGAICWAARYFGEPCKRTAEFRPYRQNERRQHEARRV